MPRKEYEKRILDKPAKEDEEPFTFSDFLLKEFGITYEQFLKAKQRKYPNTDLFGN